MSKVVPSLTPTLRTREDLRVAPTSDVDSVIKYPYYLLPTHTPTTTTLLPRRMWYWTLLTLSSVLFLETSRVLTVRTEGGRPSPTRYRGPRMSLMGTSFRQGTGYSPPTWEVRTTGSRHGLYSDYVYLV